MNFEDRKNLVEKHVKLSKKNQAQIDSHPFVVAKKKLIDKHNDAAKKLLAECTHDEVEKKSQYHEGSYYDKASTSYWTVCTLCGATSEVKRETHSWYG